MPGLRFQADDRARDQREAAIGGGQRGRAGQHQDELFVVVVVPAGTTTRLRSAPVPGNKVRRMALLSSAGKSSQLLIVVADMAFSLDRTPC